MDYDNDEFRSQNNQLAGEGTIKFPPVLHSYALPKFDFDDRLHGHLRFDSLVETEVFLGIEANRENRWIDEFSRGNSGADFNSSSVESCCIYTHKNVWSEATSSESVEMLLESVGQGEIIPAQPTITQLEPCDELSCLIKQMEPSVKKERVSPPKSGDAIELCDDLDLPAVKEFSEAVCSNNLSEESKLKDVVSSKDSVIDYELEVNNHDVLSMTFEGTTNFEGNMLDASTSNAGIGSTSQSKMELDTQLTNVNDNTFEKQDSMDELDDEKLFIQTLPSMLSAEEPQSSNNEGSGIPVQDDEYGHGQKDSDLVTLEPELGPSIFDKREPSISTVEGCVENELIFTELEANSTIANESASDIILKHEKLASCSTIDGTPPSLGNDSATDVVIDLMEVRTLGLPVVSISTSKKVDNATQISMDTILSKSEFSQVNGDACLVSVSQKDVGQPPCMADSRTLPVVDASFPKGKVGSQTAVPIEMNSLTGDITLEKHLGLEKQEEIIVKVNYGKESSKSADSISMLRKDESLTSVEKLYCDTGQSEREECDAAVADNSFEQIDAPITNDDYVKTIASSSTSAVNDRSNSGYTDQMACSASLAAVSMELSQKDTGQGDARGCPNQHVSASEVAIHQDQKKNDASKDAKSFTFEVNALTDLSHGGAGKKRSPASTMRTSKVTLTPIEVRSPSTSVKSQLNSRTTEDSPQVNMKVPNVEGILSPSKGSPARRARRASAKSAPKENSRQGNSAKGTTPVIKCEKVGKVSISATNLPGIHQLGHVDNNGISAFSITTSASSLMDLNSLNAPSSVLYQCFTDLQQIQLRAQIFVYGALIQGTVPDEAFMISAFGGADGGRSFWYNAWHSCVERLHAVGAPGLAMKQYSLQSTSPACVRNSKGTPPSIVNPMIPHSSPLWSLTMSGDAIHPTGTPRNGINHYQLASTPSQPHQTPPVRNFSGPNTAWISQAPFCTTWVPSPLTAAHASSVRPPVLPIMEAVRLTHARESTLQQSLDAKPVSSGPTIQKLASDSDFGGTSYPQDLKNVSGPSGQHSAVPKPRKRKNNLVSEDSCQSILHAQPHVEPVSTSFMSKVLAENIITPLCSISTNCPQEWTSGAELKLFLSEETLGKVKVARTQAEDAAALATAAVTRSQEFWNELERQRNSGLPPDIKTKLASAAVAIAAAAAVAKAAAAAANVASNAAWQAKLMADEALVSSIPSNSSQSEVTIPASTLKGGVHMDNSSSIILAATEAAKKKIEAASAASKQAENMGAIVKAAELAAEAVSLAGKIVSMGDPLPLTELVAAGLEGDWKVSHSSSNVIGVSNNIIGEPVNADRIVDDLIVDRSEMKELGSSNHGKSPVLGENYAAHAEGSLGSDNAREKGSNGLEYKASDSAKTIDVVPGSENGPSPICIPSWKETNVEISKEKIIKEGSHVQVFKDGNGFKAAWFSANVLNLKDGKAYVCYDDVSVGPEKLKEWVVVEGKVDEVPRVRLARPITAIPFEGTRKRRRSTRDYSWCVGDRVDAWMKDSWWEGIVTEKNKKDETVLKVQFPAQSEISLVKVWHLQPSLKWKDGEWTEWSTSGENDRSFHEGDTPQEKRPRVTIPVVEAKAKDKTSKCASDPPDDTKLLDLPMNERKFNVGQTTRDEKKPDAIRTMRTGLQKEGSRIFGVPKPGKKRKYMDVSGSCGWKSTFKLDSKEKRLAVSKSKVLKPPNHLSGKHVSQMESSANTKASAHEDADIDHAVRTKDTLGKSEFRSSHSDGENKRPFLFSSTLSSDTASKKSSTGNLKSEKVNKGRAVGPASGRLGKIDEDKVLGGNAARPTCNLMEPRRSVRRIQPTSRLLEGLQSSLTISKAPSVSRDRNNKVLTSSHGGSSEG